MTLTAQPQPQPQPPTPSAPVPSSAPKPRRIRAAYVAVAVLAALCLIVLSLLNVSTETPYDPENSGPNGWQALHEVLEDQGVSVEVVRGLNEFPSSVDGATVLVVGTTNLSPESGQDLLQQTAAADKMVVLNPASNIGSVLDLPLRISSGSTAAREPVCDSPIFRDGDTISEAGEALILTTRVPEATTCLPPSAGFEAGGAQGGSLVSFPASDTSPELWVGGVADAFTNASVTQDANAALALRLLGGTDTLYWYIPTSADLALGNPQTLGDVLPVWLAPTAAMLGVTALAAMFIRGRRLGPIVAEPLPVTIKSMELVDARARLYERGDANAHAYRALQVAALARWAKLLGLGRGATPESIVAEVSSYTGAPEAHVASLLVDQPVSDDKSFVQAARDLHALEEGNSPR
ncbi:DUF4350 domain-containing protein [Ornithinimicrobium sp. Arc0846-15]|nr:DUF4350 domain-containing protein [Ornithinimicrobium laminariae]